MVENSFKIKSKKKIVKLKKMLLLLKNTYNIKNLILNNKSLFIFAISINFAISLKNENNKKKKKIYIKIKKNKFIYNKMRYLPGFFKTSKTIEFSFSNFFFYKEIVYIDILKFYIINNFKCILYICRKGQILNTSSSSKSLRRGKKIQVFRKI